ncbi:MAG: endolytic transglycosylase MltG [Patescibacteria group bacterium]
MTIFLSIAYLKYVSYIENPVDENSEETISFQIKKGSTAKEIGKNLKEKNLIKNQTAFYLYVKFHGLGEKIIAGRFLLNKSMNVKKIIAAITDPAQAEFIITIQEGITLKDIDQKLVDLTLINPGEFLASVKNFNGWQYYKFLDETALKTLEFPLEGYIYPDTYFLDPEDFKPVDLIYLALDNFEKKTADLPKNQSKYSFHQIITMASIIENEVRSFSDRKIVSGILWKRLENSWPLGADATLLYITDDRKITSEELKIDSPYNTRKYAGLPPGPISNPSIESITTAMSPENSDYWFYLTTLDTGEVIYAETNEEHNVNRKKYLE